MTFSWLRIGLCSRRADKRGLASVPEITVTERTEQNFISHIHAQNHRGIQSRTYFHGFTVSFFGSLAQGVEAGGLHGRYPLYVMTWPAAKRKTRGHYVRARANLLDSTPAARNFVLHMQARVSAFIASRAFCLNRSNVRDHAVPPVSTLCLASLSKCTVQQASNRCPCSPLTASVVFAEQLILWHRS